MATTIETIRIRLEMLTDKFNANVKKAEAVMQKTNTTLRKQQKEYTTLNNKIRKAASAVAVYKNSTKALSAGQKGSMTRMQNQLPIMKQQRAVMQENISKTRQLMSTQKDSMNVMKKAYKNNATDLKQKMKLEGASEKATFMNDFAQMGMAKTLSASMPDMQRFIKNGGTMNTRMGKLAMGLRKATHGMKGFRMEMLGVMFFGMSLTRIMGGLMGKSLEWTGVMDVLSSALGILFLPVAMQLLDWALQFLDWVGTLTEDQKKLIGTIVLIVGAFGIFLTVIGTLALGLGSIIQVFGGFSSVVSPLTVAGKAIGAVFGGISVSILAVIAIIVAVVVAMVVAWKENFMNMKDVVANFIGGIKDLFGGIIEMIKGIMKIVKGVFMGDWETVLEGIKQLWMGFGTALWGIIKIIINGCTAIFIGLVRIIKGIIETIIGFFVWLYDVLVGHSIIPDMIKEIVDWFLWLPRQIWNAMKGIGGMVADAFSGMIPDWMLKIFKGGASFLGKTASKIGGIFGFAKGGVVPGPKGAPMPAIVHGGERIIPNGGSGGGNINQTITINATVSNDYDVRKLADQLNRYWVSDINKLTKSK